MTDHNIYHSTMHDLLALGEYKEALSLEGVVTGTGRDETQTCGDNDNAIKDTDTENLTKPGGENNDEVLRLPLFLRLLSSSQHLASINSASTVEETETMDSADDHDKDREENENKADENETENQYVNDVVDLLEKVAVSHSAAENIELFTSYLVPKTCRPISKALSSSVSRKRRLITVQNYQSISESNNDDTYGTNENERTRDSSNGVSVSMTTEIILAKGVVVTESRSNGCQSYATSGWDDTVMKELFMKESDVGSDVNGKVHDSSTRSIDSDEEEESKGGDDVEKETSSKGKRKRAANVLDSELLNDSDSHESTVCKILLEILTLVASSLAPIQANPRKSLQSRAKPQLLSTTIDKKSLQEIDVNQKQEGRADKPAAQTFESTNFKSASAAALKLIPSSLLSEASYGPAQHSELSAIIVTLMHHTPIIRHEHLANALCRASVTQCAAIIKRLAANCCAASGALVRGCIDACRVAEMSGNNGAAAEYIGGDGVICITKSARDSVMAIASLSKREAMYVAGALRQSCIMPDVLFKILIQNDPDNAVALLWEGLSDYVKSKKAGECEDEKLSGGRMRVRERGSLFAAFRPKKRSSVLLLENMQDNVDLVQRTRIFLAHQLKLLSENSNYKVWGRAVIFIQATGLFTKFAGIGTEDLAQKFVNNVMLLVEMARGRIFGQARKIDECSDKNDRQLSATSCCDDLIKSALATCVEICSKSVRMSTFVSCFQPYRTWFISSATKNYALRIHALAVHSEIQSLSNLIIAALLNDRNDIFIKMEVTASETSELQNFCSWTKEVMPVYDTNISMTNTNALIQMGQMKNAPKDNNFDELVKVVFNDIEKCDALYHENEALVLIRTAIDRFGNADTPKLPLILPLTIEKKCRNLFKDQGTAKIDTKEWRQLVIHLVYAFAYLEDQPMSAFAIIPRTLQLKEIVNNICNLPPNELNKKLLTSIDRLCPELVDQGFDKSPCIQDGTQLRLSQKLVKPKDVTRAILGKLDGSLSASVREGAIERLFLSSRSTFPSNEVDVEVASALLASVEDSFHFMSYLHISKDPLVLLKCSLKVWSCNELRRVLLSILNRALLAHDTLIDQSSTTPSVLSECLVSRDAVVVRCFLFLLSGSYQHAEMNQSELQGSEVEINPICCPIMISMVRYMVAKRRGLAATVIKQALPSIALDWFVQNVPETFSDVHEFSAMLESRSLSMVEKLRIADGTLRITIVHGSHDNTSQRLLYNTLNALVSSFYLVIGPVGVPVNVICDGKGQDITQTCRKILFRMLAALGDINSDKASLRQEAIFALSKIASLCKSDGAVVGLSGVALQKRKKLLKQVWDSIVKTNEIYGGGVQL